jgi:hypothetical protein
MRLLAESAMIFFGTLMAAGIIALGDPGDRFVRLPVPDRASLHTSQHTVAAAPSTPDDAPLSSSTH